MAQCRWPIDDDRVPEHLKEELRCQRNAHDDHDFCLFHIPLEEKNKDEELRAEFLERFRELYEQGEWDFAGFEFPDNVDMNGWDFRRPHEKEGRELKKGRKNTESVDFSFARFGDQARFNNAIFGDLARFVRARFGYDARFISARFGDKAHFGGARFGGLAEFDSARFGDKASFGSAEFGNQASFRGARFGEQATFANARFGDKAWFERASFGEKARFDNARFGDKARFTTVGFGDGANFDSASFGNQASFDGARFGEHTRFERASFGDMAGFWLASFGSQARFDGASFGEQARFDYASFGDHARFDAARFGDNTSFLRSTFMRAVNWRFITGQERAYVARGGPEGQEQSFTGELLRPTTPGLIFERASFGGPALFHRTDLSRTRFQQVDLRNVSFLHSQISQTKFITCTWGKCLESRRFLHHIDKDWPLLRRWAPLLRLGRPRLLFDELAWRKKKSRGSIPGPYFDLAWLWSKVKKFLWVGVEEEWEPGWRTVDGYDPPGDLQASDIEVLALQLKKSLEDTKDPIAAGDFHFAAMEMKREQASEQGRWGRAAGLWIYKMLNGYGERYGRALLWIALLVAPCAPLYGWLGGLLQPHEAERVVKGTVALAKAAEPQINDYILYAMQNVLPFKFSKPVLEAVLAPARWLSFIETFIGTTLFAFFVLALRRRFKR